jgi:hypothetical protein
VAEYTIEHILPQNPELPAAWREALGSDWRQVQEEWLHRLGNLTLTGYNPELGNRPFLEKRDGKGGFARSPLHVNEGLGQLERWDVEAMSQRGERQAYQPGRSRPLVTPYTLENHPQLANLQIREVFDAPTPASAAWTPT